MTIRTVIGEDDFFVRQGVERALDTHSDIEVVASCADLSRLRVAIDEQRHDLEVTDIRMPPT